MWLLFQSIIKHNLNFLNHHMVHLSMYIFKRTLISIFLSVKGTVENVDELIMRMKGIKAGFVCVYFERGKNIYIV